MKPNTSKPDIMNFTRPQLMTWLGQNGHKPFRAGQIFKWLYLHQAETFDDMTDISKPTRQKLASQFAINRLQQVAVQKSVDGSAKFLFRLTDGNHIESVLIPEKKHYTLCISSQVGCAQGCRFCLTAKGGFTRNLSTAEIIAQVRDISHNLTGSKPLTNIVLMGMGEPLANYHNVVSAIETLTDGDFGLKISTRRITVSTVGLISGFSKLGQDTTVNIAISLNATDNKTRNYLMPINKIYPIEMLIDVCKTHPLPPRRKITFEYILIKDVNDTLEDAHRLADLLRPVRAKINLIPFNEFEGSEFKSPEEETILRFQDVLTRKNYTAVIRRSKGRDISAACGQLRANTIKNEKSD